MVKQFLTKPPVLVPPCNGESLLLYISATTQVVSSALVVEREEEGHAFKVQCPVYFISEVLSDSKARYSQIQKLLYTVLITKRKLRHYFESRWLHTAKRSDSWRTNSTASNSITSQGASMRRPMH